MIGRLIWQTLAWLACMGVLLFVPAGTLRWPAAWIFLAEMGASVWRAASGSHAMIPISCANVYRR